MNSERVRQRSIFDDVLYAQCWEDPSLDRAAFGISSDDVVFTITSGGCNALAFLLDDPKEVQALDLNPHQNHVLDLKCAALRSLSYGSLLEFVGAIPSRRRRLLYHGLRDSLADDARSFWDSKPAYIEGGILHCGRFERYVRMLGRMTQTIIGPEVILSFFQARDAEERRHLYARHWDTYAWALFTRVFLSRTLMSLLFDKAFFAQLEGDFSFGRHFASVIRHALVELEPRTSPFLSYALLGRFYDHSSLPFYLREENIPVIRHRLDRITLRTGDCGTYFRSLPAAAVSRFNFTNIFEWMPADAFEGLLRETIRVASDGAVMTYRNLLVPRSHPASLAGIIRPRAEEARMLHRRDLSFLYRSYVVEEIHTRKTHHVAQRQTSRTAV